MDSIDVYQDISEDISANKIDRLIRFGEELLGKPYRYRLPDGRIMDCSGYLSYIYGHGALKLPNSSSAMARKVEKVTLDDIKKGDILFFKGRNIQNDSIGHVAMVASVNGDQIDMMHSSISGILVETYNDNPYYTDRFLFAGRHPQFVFADQNEGGHEEMNIAGSSHDANDETNGNERHQTIRIIGVGDIMLGTNYPDSSYLPSNDGKDILTPVKDITNRGDIVFGNLEGVFLTGDGPVKRCSDPVFCYAFKMPDHYVNYLVDAGFNLLSVANNHVNDFGTEGAENTIQVLERAGIHHAGLTNIPYATFEKNGLKIGFAAFSPNRGTIIMHNYDNVRSIISHLDSISDIVIVSFHGGAEGSSKKHITRETEMYLGENRGNPYEFARMVIDAGADIVLGHGPHVTRAIDIYKGRFIAYSLGNFATYARFNLSGPNGIAPIIEIVLDNEGKFLEGQIYSIKQIGRGGPIIDANDGALKEIKELTKTDIPESPIKINSGGRMTIRTD